MECLGDFGLTKDKMYSSLISWLCCIMQTRGWHFCGRYYGVSPMESGRVAGLHIRREFFQQVI